MWWFATPSTQPSAYAAQRRLDQIRRMAQDPLPDDEDQRRHVQDLGNGSVKLSYEYEPEQFVSVYESLSTWTARPAEGKEQTWRNLRRRAGT